MKRAKKLEIECFQSIDNKLEKIKIILKESKLEIDEVVFVGNDLNDLEAMKYLSNTYCPKDSHPTILKVAKKILSSPGGQGVIMDLYNILA